MKYIASIILLFSGIACSSSEFEGQSNSSERQVTEDVMVQVEQPDNSANLEAKDKTETKEMISEPIMVGGAFLNCRVRARVLCRLDTETEQNIEIPEDANVDFFDGFKTPVQHIDADGNWRWEIVDTEVLSLSRLVLEISNEEQSVEYTADVEFRPIHIGDGTSRLQGCRTNIIGASQSVGNRYRRDLVVTEASLYKINLRGVCGILRPNDTFIRIVSDQGVVVLRKFIAPTNRPMPFNEEIELTPGTYRLSLVAGNDRDIDDFFFNSLAISQVGK